MKTNLAFACLCVVIILYCLYLDTSSDSYKFQRFSTIDNNHKHFGNNTHKLAVSRKNIIRHELPNYDSLSSTEVLSIHHKYILQCKPEGRIVFSKTHKTGSSTLTSILQRYGYVRNLSIAIPKRNSHVISLGFFKTPQVFPGKYDMLVNHVRFDKAEMQKVMKPGAKYVTIIRDSRTQLESVFGYFLMFKNLHLPESNAFKKFISQPKYYWDKYSSFTLHHYLRNPNLYDLGLQPNDQLNEKLVTKAIQRIAEQFDLILIQEYYNESLLLLKKLMCLSFDDILYIPKGIRSSKRRYNISDDLRESINKWSWADVRLYAHFNTTFWERVRDYGPSFQNDLKTFEEKIEETRLNCTIANKTKDNAAHREAYLLLNPEANESCILMMKNDPDFTRLIRIKQNMTVKVAPKRNVDPKQISSVKIHKLRRPTGS